VPARRRVYSRLLLPLVRLETSTCGVPCSQPLSALRPHGNLQHTEALASTCPLDQLLQRQLREHAVIKPSFMSFVSYCSPATVRWLHCRQNQAPATTLSLIFEARAPSQPGFGLGRPAPAGWRGRFLRRRQQNVAHADPTTSTINSGSEQEAPLPGPAPAYQESQLSSTLARYRRRREQLNICGRKVLGIKPWQRHGPRYVYRRRAAPLIPVPEARRSGTLLIGADAPRVIHRCGRYPLRCARHGIAARL